MSEQRDEYDLVYLRCAYLRERDLAEARASYSDAIASAERRFAERLTNDAVATIERRLP